MKRQRDDEDGYMRDLFSKFSRRKRIEEINERGYLAMVEDFIQNRPQDGDAFSTRMQFEPNKQSPFHCLMFYSGYQGNFNSLFNLYVDSSRYPFQANTLIHIIRDLIIEIPDINYRDSDIYFYYQFPPGVRITCESPAFEVDGGNKVGVLYRGLYPINGSKYNFYCEGFDQTDYLMSYDFDHAGERIIAILRDFATFLERGGEPRTYKFRVSAKFKIPEYFKKITSEFPFVYNPHLHTPAMELIKRDMLLYLRLI